MDGPHLHRRKSSKDEDENIVLITRPIEDQQPPAFDVPLVSAPPPPRNRVQSSPVHHRSISSLGVGPPTIPYNLQRHPASPFRSSFAPVSPTAHSRTRSISSNAFLPSVHSPLSSSFPPPTPPTSISSPTLYAFPPAPSPMNTSKSAPDGTGLNLNPNQPTSRRHARLHSRNLSVFFPRPGSIPHASIAEDGAQELEIQEEAPTSVMPSAGPSISIPGSHSRANGPATPLGAGFTFGARPPPSALADMMTGTGPIQPTSSRRGHHHKHSMSHSFFSFLEPGANSATGNGPPQVLELHTQPTPTPLSPWAPMSAFSQSAKASTTAFPPHTPTSENGHHYFAGEELQYGNGNIEEPQLQGALMAGFMQFILGAWLWVCGQQVGSLSVTGLGYWVVFDASGVGQGAIVNRWLDLKPKVGEETPSESERRRIRRPYGNAPVQTVSMFGQAVYLMFSAVYVCKETLEHLLLSAGSAEGHHHHHGDEDESLVGIEFPIILAFVTLLSVFGTSLLYNNHSKLVSITGSRIPTFRTLIRSLSSTSKPRIDPPATSLLGILFSNPFAASPITFTSIIIFVAIAVPVEHHRTCDLLLAALITVVTFNLAYRACTVLGTALLQTAPPRGQPGGKTEAFLRAMREVERHPQVLHLPAPHIWQLTPTPDPSSTGKSTQDEALVVTMELHVRHSLGDDEVLALTRWAWEKCASALGRKEGKKGPEVTVGVVRG
ncbi:hypothetical protein C0991_009469 [Blastosporella zonata]|nr:hypothetical protein C0991_009469 [Blastosporella zonata]